VYRSHVLWLWLGVDIVVLLGVGCVDQLERGEEGAQVGPAGSMRGLVVLGGGDVVLDWTDVSVSLGIAEGCAANSPS
jgi:hypothetical protein